MSRSAAAIRRTRASRDRLRAAQARARRRGGVHRRGPRRPRHAAAGDLAHGRLLRDADPAARARQGPLCRRAGGRRRGREPLSRRGRGRADRDRFRAAAGGRRSRACRARRARRSCTRRPAPTSCSAASSSAATSTPRSRRRRCGSKAASACAARPRSRSSRAPACAEYEPGRDALTLYSATQVPGIVRNALAEALDMPGHRLRVVAPDVGGGFGGKGSLYPEEIFVCVAARQLARSVKWTSDRMEDLAATSQAFDEIVDAELGARSRRPGVGAARGCDRRRRAPIRSIPGPLRSSRSRSSASCPAPIASSTIAAACARWRPRRRRSDLIAASGDRSRPSSWNG